MIIETKLGGCPHCHADRIHHRGDRTVRFGCGSYEGFKGFVQSEQCKQTVRLQEKADAR